MSNNKYEKAKVYKIWSTRGDKIYVGSTCKDYLSQRMTAHRGDYYKWKRGTHGHMTSFVLFDEYGVENCSIELLEAKDCKSKDELKQLEGKYIRELSCVNKLIVGRTIKEYREDNKEKISEQERLKYQRTKETILIQKKQYYEDNKEKMNKNNSCECGGKYTSQNKLQHLKSNKHCQFIESKKLTEPFM